MPLRGIPSVRLHLALAVALLLAGCASAPAETSTTASSTTQVAKLNATAAPKLVVAHAYLNDTGSLGVSFGGCVFPADACQFPDSPLPGKTDFLFATTPGNLTAFDATLTWQAASLHTATLALGAMVMYECDGCNQTFLGELEGTSPLRFTADKLAAALGPGQVVHFYVYNPGAAVAHPSVPGFAYATTDQAFEFAGKVTTERRA